MVHYWQNDIPPLGSTVTRWERPSLILALVDMHVINEDSVVTFIQGVECIRTAGLRSHETESLYSDRNEGPKAEERRGEEGRPYGLGLRMQLYGLYGERGTNHRQQSH